MSQLNDLRCEIKRIHNILYGFVFVLLTVLTLVVYLCVIDYISLNNNIMNNKEVFNGQSDYSR